MHVSQWRIREMHAIFLWEPEAKDSLKDLRLRCVINKWWAIFRMVMNQRIS